MHLEEKQRIVFPRRELDPTISVHGKNRHSEIDIVLHNAVDRSVTTFFFENTLNCEQRKLLILKYQFT